MSDHGDLGRRLDDLAARGRSHLARERRRQALPRVLDRVVPWLVAAPALLLVGRLFFGIGPLPLPVLVGLAVWPPVVFFLIEFLPTLALRPSRAASLGLLDRRADARDRLVAADEFLRRPERTAFMEAAVEDAVPFAERAGEAVLAPAPAPAPSAARATLSVLATAGAIALILLLPGGAAAPGTGAPGTPVATGSPIRKAVVDENGPEERRPAVPGERGELRDPVEAAPDRGAVADPAAEEIPRDAKETEGRTGSGPSAGGRARSGANDARGVPSNRSPGTATPPRSESEKKPGKPKPPAEEREPGRRPKEVGDEGGRTSGKGSSRGSTKNPVASEWSSRDKVSEEDEEEAGEDEDVEDEDSDSEARGGVQPSLRDRKPPTSRDLSIGFGNRPNPNAEGRGGPSQPKKSRGTASLVLGVPIPDRVKGQKNPGRTKITHERVEPRREESDVVTAGAREPRAAPAGHVSSPALSPWLARIVKDYFLALRNRGEEETR